MRNLEPTVISLKLILGNMQVILIAGFDIAHRDDGIFVFLDVFEFKLNFLIMPFKSVFVQRHEVALVVFGINIPGRPLAWRNWGSIGIFDIY